MIALDPTQSVRDLEAALVNGVGNAEVVTEREVVGNVQVGLAGRTRKLVVPPGPLNQKGVDHCVLKRRIQRADQRLIIDEKVAPAARRANAAAILSVTDQLIRVARVLDVVSRREAIVLSQLMIESGEAVVVILDFQNAQVFARDAQQILRPIDGRQIIQKTRRVDRGLGSSLAFVIQEDESPVFSDRASQRAAELILPQRLRRPLGLKEGTRVQGAVLEIVVNR